MYVIHNQVNKIKDDYIQHVHVVPASVVVQTAKQLLFLYY